MGVRSKFAIAILALALGCTPVLAQQGPPNQPPAPAPNRAPAGPGPGGPRGPMRGRGMHVWIDRRPGRGWAGWRSRNGSGDWGSALRMGDLGLGETGLNGPLTHADRALNDPQIRQQLGISDQEATKLEQQVTDFLKTMVQDRANLDIQRIDLQSLLAAENPDNSAVDDQLQKVSAAQLTLDTAAVNFALTLKQEVTPEQRQKIREFLRERRSGSLGRENGPWQRHAGAWQSNRRHRSGRSQGRQRQNDSASPQNSPGEPRGSTPQTTTQ